MYTSDGGGLNRSLVERGGIVELPLTKGSLAWYKPEFVDLARCMG